MIIKSIRSLIFIFLIIINLIINDCFSMQIRPTENSNDFLSQRTSQQLIALAAAGAFLGIVYGIKKLDILPKPHPQEALINEKIRAITYLNSCNQMRSTFGRNSCGYFSLFNAHEFLCSYPAPINLSGLETQALNQFNISEDSCGEWRKFIVNSRLQKAFASFIKTKIVVQEGGSSSSPNKAAEKIKELRKNRLVFIRNQLADTLASKVVKNIEVSYSSEEQVLNDLKDKHIQIPVNEPQDKYGLISKELIKDNAASLKVSKEELIAEADKETPIENYYSIEPFTVTLNDAQDALEYYQTQDISIDKTTFASGDQLGGKEIEDIIKKYRLDGRATYLVYEDLQDAQVGQREEFFKKACISLDSNKPVVFIINNERVHWISMIAISPRKYYIADSLNQSHEYNENVRDIITNLELPADEPIEYDDPIEYKEGAEESIASKKINNPKVMIGTSFLNKAWAWCKSLWP